MTDQRPRPQYGEYATPEEQARALGLPAQKAQHPSPAHQPDVPVLRDAARETKRAARARFNRPRDIVITVTLLAIGLVWVLLSVPGTSDLAATLDRTYALQGYTGRYGPVALASAIGMAINISSIALWGISAAVSIGLMRTHRRAFYIPIIGAAISGTVAIVLTLVALLSDPGLIAYMGSLQK
ncbi:DUF6264 family protein [Parafrigoribacterium humi]|jgi:hypothetical protein|uniref:DUF6264 family protein n=1 Tax=Parafrigoribacterium humi TaxID=3144664 RepID=UPI0032F07FF8